MIKPYVYVVCEKVILDQEQPGTASLIGLFSRISATIPPDSPELPDNALAPKEWAIFSSWDAEESDAGKEYTICTQIFYPNKKQFAETSKTALRIEPKKRSQAIARIPGFPIGQQGSYTIRTWIESNGTIVVEPLEIGVEVELIKTTR